MRKVKMIFQGKKKESYCFADMEGKTICFERIRTDLISQYALGKEESIGRNFIIHFFVSTHNEMDVPILSDLEIEK